MPHSALRRFFIKGLVAKDTIDVRRLGQEVAIDAHPGADAISSDGARKAVPVLPSGLMLFVLWACVTWVYVRSPVVQSYDSKWVVLQSLSLMREGNLDLDEYDDIHTDGYSTHQVNGRHYSLYPAGVVIVAAPIVWIAQFLQGADLASDKVSSVRVEMVAASIITAGSVVGIYLLLSLISHNTATSIVGSLLFAFGTAAWSTASRGLWQHGPSLLFVSFAVYALLRAKQSARWLFVCGMCIAAAYAIRPTNWTVVACVTVYVLGAFRARLGVYYLLGALPIACAFLVYNLSIYGIPLSPYHLGYAAPGNKLMMLHVGWPNPEALAAHLLSPARGLLVYSPILVVVAYSVARAMRRGRLESLDWLAIITISLHVLVISLPLPWWGGHCYGARMTSDTLPWWMLLFARQMGVLSATRHPCIAITVGLLGLVSIWINFVGATSVAAMLWNTTPVNVDWQPSRVWDWTDPPFLRDW